MLDQAKEMVNQVVVRDPAELRPIIGVLARIIIDDRPESRAELVEQKRVDVIGRGDPRNDEKRRAVSKRSERSFDNPARPTGEFRLGRRSVATS